MNFRVAKEQDSKQIAEIYGYYVENSNASFETVAPSEQEMQNRIAQTLENYPYIVCEMDGKIVGFSYASQHNPRIAYRYNAVLTAYLHKDYLGKKIGTKILLKVMEILKKQGYCNIYSCITSTNKASLAMHERMEFTNCGTFENSGHKFDEWIGVTWMSKRVSENAGEIIKFVDFDKEKVEKILKNT